MVEEVRRPSCLAMRRPVPTVVALRGYLLVAFEPACELCGCLLVIWAWAARACGKRGKGGTLSAESDTECHGDMIFGGLVRYMESSCGRDRRVDMYGVFLNPEQDERFQ